MDDNQYMSADSHSALDKESCITDSGSCLKLIHLEITGEANRLKISAQERATGGESTIQHYEEISISMEWINTKCRELTNTLNKANRRGRITPDILMKLVEIGQVFYDELFTLTVKDLLQNTSTRYLRLTLDGRLMHVPWELLHDGQIFLCRKFNMGRHVKTRQTILNPRARTLAKPIKVWILADPVGDLKGAYTEGMQLRDYMDQNMDFVNVTMQAENISTDLIRQKIRQFDMVHFAGHADYDPQNPNESGWRLSNGILKTEDISKLAGTAAMPSLIFSNACQSARTEAWSLNDNFEDKIFGLANTFLLTGVNHFVGTFWEIMDEPSRHFSLEFYKYIFSGYTIGEAIRLARMELIRKYGEETIIWASYLLYGDPCFNYMEHIKTREPDRETEPVSALGTANRARIREEVIDFGQNDTPKKRKSGRIVLLVLSLIIVMFLWGYPGILRQGVSTLKNTALTYYKEGNFDQALDTCRILENKNPQIRMAYLIQGNIFFKTGRLDDAEQAFNKAIKVTDGSDTEMSDAYIGLGRIASLRGQSDLALDLYNQAIQASPDKNQGYLSQGLLLARLGDYDKATPMLEKALELSPDNRDTITAYNEIRQRTIHINDQEKQERIDHLVKELLERKETTSLPATSEDTWTSRPLTIWVMDFESSGYTLKEGEERLLTSGIISGLVGHARVRIVERAFLDKLMEELKLGTSKLADTNAALSLGRIMAARLILTGKITYTGARTQVSMRLIETETGRISAAFDEKFEDKISSAQLSSDILAKLDTLYPLRGEVTEVTHTDIKLNIGDLQGVQVGQLFKAPDSGTILEIRKVYEDHSIAKWKEGTAGITPGLRLEILLKKETTL